VIRVEASRVIERPIGDVWAYLSNLDNMPAWDTGLVRIAWQPPLRLGMEVEMHDASPILRLLDRLVGPFVFKVSEYEEARRFGLRVMRGKSRLEAVYSLDSVDAERTRITRVGTVQGEGVWKVLELMLRPRATREREVEVTNLKRILESR
jgi:hypothetical protein